MLWVLFFYVFIFHRSIPYWINGDNILNLEKVNGGVKLIPLGNVFPVLCECSFVGTSGKCERRGHAGSMKAKLLLFVYSAARFFSCPFYFIYHVHMDFLWSLHFWVFLFKYRQVRHTEHPCHVSVYFQCISIVAIDCSQKSTPCDTEFPATVRIPPNPFGIPFLHFWCVLSCYLIWIRMCVVPTAFACMQIEAILWGFWALLFFFLNTLLLFGSVYWRNRFLNVIKSLYKSIFLLKAYFASALMRKSVLSFCIYSHDLLNLLPPQAQLHEGIVYASWTAATCRT